MCRYLLLSVFTSTLCLLSSAQWDTAERIEELEALIAKNNEMLRKLETEVENERTASNAESTESSLCELSMHQKQAELGVCRKQLEEQRTQLKLSNEQITGLSLNLTICRINNQLDEHETIDASSSALVQQISELSEQLLAKDRHIELLQQESRQHLERLQAAQSKLKAYDEQLDQFHPSSCLPFGSVTGIYRIKLPGLKSFYAPCDARYAGGGWMVIQRRMDGSENFYRNWSDYKAGFGAINGEFFIGLEKLHRLTALQPHELFVHLEDFEDEMRYAHYDNFRIGSEADAYELSSLGKYDGNAGNAMGINVLQKFSTLDQDNDSWTNGSCARRYHSAWWYGGCAAYW